MKVDLYCHTREVKKGCGEGRYVSVDLFKEMVAYADVKIIAKVGQLKVFIH